MKIAVIGAGMAGVAVAQALAADGHQVAVFERRASVAEETSFAPAGIAAAGLAAPWTPAPGRLRATLAREEDAHLREIGAAFAAPRVFGGPSAGQAAARAAQALALHRLLATGIDMIDGLAQALKLDFECSRGLLLALPDAACVAQAEVAAAWLEQAGGKVVWADAARQRALEPGRTVADEGSRAVWLPDAHVGNTREWTQLLRGNAQHLGVKFLFQHEVATLSAGPRPTLRYTDLRAGGPLHEAAFDAVVVSAALDSARLVAPLGVKLPWRGVAGWSVTVPMHLREAAPETGPHAALVDVRSGISIGRIGTRLRVAGGHEPAPPAVAPGEPPSARLLRPLYEAVDAAFPGAVLWQQAQPWQGTRALLPDGLPAVGASGVPGVWLNVGHAHHGWPLSQVAADALCTMIAGQPAHSDVGALAPQRLR